MSVFQTTGAFDHLPGEPVASTHESVTAKLAWIFIRPSAVPIPENPGIMGSNFRPRLEFLEIRQGGAHLVPKSVEGAHGAGSAAVSAATHVPPESHKTHTALPFRIEISEYLKTFLRQLLNGSTFELVKHPVEVRRKPMQPGEPNAVAEAITADLSNEFLSSARVFAWSVSEVIERTVLREVAGDSLTFSQLKLLYLVAHTDVLNIGDAAAFLGVTCGAASKAVDKLVRRRLLRRVAPAEDRRTFRLSLTETSRKLMEAYQAARDYRAKLALEQFPPDELRRTSELLDRLAGAIVSSSANPNAMCMQCEIYFRERCRFGECGRRNCFYQYHKTRDLRPGNDHKPAEGKVI